MPKTIALCAALALLFIPTPGYALGGHDGAAKTVAPPEIQILGAETHTLPSTDARLAAKPRNAYQNKNAGNMKTRAANSDKNEWPQPRNIGH